MKKFLAMTALVSTLAIAQSASFAASHHTMKAKVNVLASHAKTAAYHHGKAACPSTPKCKCN